MATPVQVFNDSDLGVATAIALHTLGALGFLGGVAAYLAWHRALRRGHDHHSLLRVAAFTTYLSIAVNLLGGFMRTFESDHPALEQIQVSPWVQAIAVKHLFLFAGMAAAVFLFEHVAPRARLAFQQGTFAHHSPTRHRAAASIAVLGIAMAAVLGAVSQVVAEFPAAAPPTMETHAAVSYQNFTGALDGNPAVPAHGGGAFIVPPNATSLAITLKTMGNAVSATWKVTQPDGTVQSYASDPQATGQATSNLQVFPNPKAGAWRFDIDSPAASGATWSFSAKTTVPEHGMS